MGLVKNYSCLKKFSVYFKVFFYTFLEVVDVKKEKKLQKDVKDGSIVINRTFKNNVFL